MTVKEMHYNFKRKLNKVDSAQYKNFQIPEIDNYLNEAQELFIEMVAEPSKRSYLGFEINQASIDDIRTLVVRQGSDSSSCIDVQNNIVSLPEKYLHFTSGNVYMSKGNCTDIKARFHQKQQDDEFEESPFDKSSFEWREVNGVFFDGGIQLFDDGTFTNKKFCMNYIRKPNLIYDAADFKGGSYTTLSGKTLTDTSDCELPEHTHKIIVDIAVFLATGEIQSSEYNLKLQKLKIDGLV